MSLKEQGIAKFGRLIDQNIAQGAYLTGLIEAEPMLEIMAPTAINIVCFRHRLPGATEDEMPRAEHRDHAAPAGRGHRRR